MTDTTYDPTTQTVAADDGGRLTVWEIDDCPQCGGHLTHWIGGGGPDIAMCCEVGCDFVVERWSTR